MFQLVLQFAPWDPARFDDLIALEEELIATLGTRAEPVGIHPAKRVDRNHCKPDGCTPVEEVEWDSRTHHPDRPRR